MLSASECELVVFDCDGVLVDSERLSIEVEARVLGDLGWALSPAEVVARWMGRSSAAQHAEVAGRLGPAAAAEFEARTHQEIRSSFATDLLPVPGVETVLDALDDAGVATCLASSGTHERIHHTLGLTGLLPRFAGRIFSVEDVTRGKPAPDLFLHAARVSGAEPRRCAVVEDSVPGVSGAIAAGMRAFGYTALVAAEDLAAAGAHVVDDLTALVSLLLPSRAPDATAGPGSRS